MSNKTFGFNEDGELVEDLGPPAMATNQLGPMPDIPATIHELYRDFTAFADHMSGVHDFSELWINRGLGHRTLSGVLMQEQQAQNRLQSGFLDIMKVRIDPYCPATVRRQFRFPRSKKKRIQKKWRKNPRNWRDENVMFLVNTNCLKMRNAFAAIRNFKMEPLL